MLDSLFAKYPRLVLFDTETTGLNYSRDEIIEFAAVVVEQRDGKPTIIREYDELVRLTPGNTIPLQIQQLTGITNEDVAAKGISKEQLCRDISEMITEGLREADQMLGMLIGAAKDAGVQLRQIEARQQSCDHPILWGVEETNYLKFYLFQVV